MKYACLLALLIAAACAPSVDDVAVTLDAPADEPVIDENEQCEAADFRPLIGAQVTETSLQTGDMLRVYSEDDIITQEYIPQRTNVVFRSAGDITRIYCG